MLILYAFSGVLDFVRQRLLAHVARRVDDQLSARVFALLPVCGRDGAARGDGLQPLRDLDQIRAFLSGSGPTALFDLPWMPLYLAVIFVLHPLLGAFATAAAALLVAMMLLAHRRSAGPLQQTAQSAGTRWAFAAAAWRNAEVIRAMGFAHHLTARWAGLNRRHRESELAASRPANAFGAAIRAARPALQAGLIAIGACLVIAGEGSPGMMIAACVVLSRALVPIETAIAHWRSFAAARQAQGRLAQLLREGAPEHEPPRVARPHRSLRVDSLVVTPPGAAAPVIRGVGFALPAGAGLGIVGPSASGKSTLARTLVGAWVPQSGCVRLDGHVIGPWNGGHVGYLPQDVALLSGTIADNIARFDANANPVAVTAAAQAAGIDAMIARLPAGYATDIGEGGGALSAGQRQRIALARALYGDPFLVVLDEPDASLDAEGERALVAAIAAVRSRGGIVVVIAHRPAALAGVDHVLALKDGRVCAYGRKDVAISTAEAEVRAHPALPRPMPE
jgi:ATP-binding cassette subfamily C protein